jgi:hypothetical protein
VVLSGKQCSTCERGPEHGPYWYWYGRRGGRLVSRYVLRVALHGHAATLLLDRTGTEIALPVVTAR